MSWLVTTRLDGHAHNKVYFDALYAHGRAPARVAVDGDQRWSGVEHAIGLLWGDEPDGGMVTLNVGPDQVQGVGRRPHNRTPNPDDPPYRPTLQPVCASGTDAANQLGAQHTNREPLAVGESGNSRYRRRWHWSFPLTKSLLNSKPTLAVGAVFEGVSGPGECGASSRRGMCCVGMVPNPTLSLSFFEAGYVLCGYGA